MLLSQRQQRAVAAPCWRSFARGDPGVYFLGLPEDQLEGVGSVFHFVPGFFQAGVEDVEREKGADRDEETARRGDERLGHTASDPGSLGRDVAALAEFAEGAHHARDRAEEAEERRRRDDGVQRRQTLLEAGQFLVGGADERVGDRGVLVAESVDEDPGNEVFAFLAEDHRALDVPTFDFLEDFLHHLVITIGVFANHEEDAFNGDSHGEEHEQQDGPHDKSSRDEQLHRSFAHE